MLKGAYSGTTYLGDNGSNNKITAVALGGYHSIALAADGTVYSWGRNNNGQLGNNTTAHRTTPVQVLKGEYSGTTHLGDDTNNKITAVALGSYHSIALAADGTLYSWGYNFWGQLGDNTTAQRLTPIKVNGDGGSGDLALPVELSSFTVEATNQGVLCKWTTESEIENLGFILERKTEDTNWLEIASYKTADGLLGQGTISFPTDYEYLDELVQPNTTYEYRLADVDYNGIITYQSIRKVTVEQAPLSSKIEEFTVLPAYPNPFNPSTTIRYGIPVEGTGRDLSVQIAIYDITGQLIATLLNEEQSPGWYSVIWNGTNQQGEQVPAGLYFSRIKSGNDVKTVKLMLLK